MLACLTKVSDGSHPLDSVQQTTLINWNKEMKDIIKVVKCIEKSNLLLGNVSKTIRNEAKKDNEVNFLACY